MSTTSIAIILQTHVAEELIEVYMLYLSISMDLERQVIESPF